MKTVKGRFGLTAFTDSLEVIESMEEGSFDLCLTDPPWNVDTGALKKRYHASDFLLNGRETGQYVNKDFYDDLMSPEDYEAFCRRWFNAAMLACDMLIFVPGNKNLHLWFDIMEPKEILINYIPNSVSITHSCRFAQFQYILCYGQLRPFMFRSNVIVTPLRNSYNAGFGLVHPNIKEYGLWLSILERIKPKSVLEPFSGSGTTLEACEELGIKYLGFELRDMYEEDIQKRVSRGMGNWKERNRKFTIEGVV